MYENLQVRFKKKKQITKLKSQNNKNFKYFQSKVH